MEPPLSSGCKCCSCNSLFHPAPNNKATQRYCPGLACRTASKAAASAKWRAKNPGYDSGPEQVARVTEWRRQHPGYSRGKKRKKTGVALQDIAPTQVVHLQGVAKSEISAPKDISPVANQPSAPEPCNARALQDLALVQVPLVMGLIAIIAGDALQDSFADLTRSIVDRGQRVLAQNQDGFGFLAAS